MKPPGLKECLEYSANPINTLLLVFNVKINAPKETRKCQLQSSRNKQMSLITDETNRVLKKARKVVEPRPGFAVARPW